MEYKWLKSYPRGVRSEISIPEEMTVHDLIDGTCRRYARRKALTCEGTDLTFRQLERRAGYLAAWLQVNAGIEKGDRVAIMLPNIIQFPISLYGVLKAGGVCVNTNPAYTPREMHHQLKDSGAKAIVILDMFLPKLEEIIQDTAIEHVLVTSMSDQMPVWKGPLVSLWLRLRRVLPGHNLETTELVDALHQGAGLEWDPPEVTPGDLALLQYTGGTSGVFRGAMLSHRNLVANILQNQAWSAVDGPGVGDIVLTALPLYHVFALTVNFLSFFTAGARMILVPHPMPVKNTVDIFYRYPVTVMTGVNPLYRSLNRNRRFRDLEGKCLRIALAGGMPLDPEVNDEFNRLTGVRIMEGFGLTEASPVTHCNPLGGKIKNGSCGLPLPSTQAQIVDPKGQALPTGEEGELLVRGPQVMQGYWKNEAASKDSLQKGWLRTGDVARMDEDGYFYIVDRIKDMILVSGFNVYPREVEEVLQEHPGVRDVAVVGVRDATGAEAVKAYIVPENDTLNEGDLRRYCKAFLTGYKKPRYYEFRKELPRSDVGKLLRTELFDKSTAQ